jgi:AcrR family transcriptional regulator
MAKQQRPALREQKHTMVRDEILRAASALFAARGYRAITTDDIAEAIGLTKSAMYYYFKNKYDLLSTIFHDSFEHYLTHARAIAAEEGSPESRMRGLIRQHILNAIEMREWTTIFFRERSELNDKDRAFIQSCIQEYSELFERAYTRGVRAGVFKKLPPMMVVNYIVGACNSVIMWMRDDGELTPQQVADIMTTLVEAGFRQR